MQCASYIFLLENIQIYDAHVAEWRINRYNLRHFQQETEVFEFTICIYEHVMKIMKFMHMNNEQTNKHNCYKEICVTLKIKNIFI